MQNPLLRAYILAYILLRVGEDAGLIACILQAKIIIKIYLSENKEVTLLMQQNW